MEPAVQQYLTKFPAEKSKSALFIRDVVLSVDKDITDSIKWSALTFSYKKTSFAFVYTRPNADYVNLAFFKAVELNDPTKLFEGTGKGMRHIKVKTTKDVPVAQVKKWVKETIALLKLKDKKSTT